MVLPDNCPHAHSGSTPTCCAHVSPRFRSTDIALDRARSALEAGAMATPHLVETPLSRGVRRLGSGLPSWPPGSDIIGQLAQRGLNLSGQLRQGRGGVAGRPVGGVECVRHVCAQLPGRQLQAGRQRRLRRNATTQPSPYTELLRRSTVWEACKTSRLCCIALLQPARSNPQHANLPLPYGTLPFRRGRST